MVGMEYISTLNNTRDTGVQLIRVYIVEDEAAHAEVISRALKSVTDTFSVHVAETLAQYHILLQSKAPDIVLADLNLPDGGAFDILGNDQGGIPFPVIVMTAYGDEEIAVRAIKAGAIDYVVKSTAVFFDMPKVIQHALREWNHVVKHRQAEQALRQSEERYRDLVENVGEGICLVDENEQIVYMNTVGHSILGINTESVQFFNLADITAPEYQTILSEQILARAQGREGAYELKISTPGKGVEKMISVTSTPRYNAQGEFIGAFVIFHDITEEKKRKRLAEETSARIQLQNEILVALATSESVSEGLVPLVIKEFTEIIGSGFEYERVAVWLFNEDRTLFTCADLYLHPEGQHISGESIDVSEMWEQFNKLRTLKFISASDARKNIIMNQYAGSYIEKTGIKSKLDAIIRVSGIAVGAVTFEMIREPRVWRQDEESFICQLADQFGIAIMNRRRRGIEENFQSIVQTLPHCIYRVGLDGKLTFANKAFLDLFGATLDVVAGKTPDEFLQNAISQRIALDDQKVMETGIPIHQIESMTDPLTGSANWVEVYKTAVYDDLGRVTGMQGIFWMVTEKVLLEASLKKADEALRKSESIYRSIFDNSLYGIAITDADTRFVQVNPAFCKMVEYSEEELLGDITFWNITHPEDAHMSSIYTNKLRQGELNYYVSEKRYIAKSGKEIPVIVYVTGLYGEQGEYQGFTASMMEITDRKRFEAALLTSEQQLNFALDATGEGVWDWDINSDIVKHNAQWSRIFGMSETRLEHSFGEVKHLIHPDDYNRVSDEMQAALTAGVNFQSEHRIIYPDGHIIWVEDRGKIVARNDNGSPSRMVGSAVDITHRKDAETVLQKQNIELKLAKEEAEEMNRIKSNFLANMSHELRTPMIGILGYAEILTESLERETDRKMVETIYSSARRLFDTLNLILDLSKIEAGKLEIVPGDIDVVETLKSVLHVFARSAEKKSLQLHLKTEWDRYIFNTDERVLREIMNNLINNAIKFTPEGSITVICGAARESEKEHIIIRVIDTGIGISPESQEYIFDEFRQASEGFGRSFEGSGLGLSITKKFVEKLGGTITLHSELGKGSEFIITLPVINLMGEQSSVAEEQEKPPLELAPVRPFIAKVPVLSSHKILLVENDEVNQGVIELFLMGRFHLKIVAHGEEALDVLQKEHFDIILMDINLGREMNGLEVTKRIRAMNRIQDIPIIAVTAFAMEGDREEFIVAGCTDYLAKPFGRNDLLKKIRQYLPKSRDNEVPN